LLYAQSGKVSNLNPWKGDVSTARALAGVYENLIRMDHREAFDFRVDRELKPGLAESWEIADPTTFVFHLRRNIKWHDGKPLTADDVVYSMRSWTEADKAPEPRRSAGGQIATAEAIDPYTVRVTTKAISAYFLETLAYQRNVYILPKHVEDVAKNPVGSGAFKVVKQDPDAAVVVERNPDFYIPGRPYLDGGKVHNTMPIATQQAAFAGKAIDFITYSDKAQADAFQKQVPQVKVSSYCQDHGESVIMKLDKPPFSDIRVRRAIHLAIDRQGLIATTSFGAGKINPPGAIGWQPFAIQEDELLKLPGWRQPKTEDIAEAKRLLAEAGYATGLKMPMQFNRDRADKQVIPEALVPMLRGVGIDAEVQLLERGVAIVNERDGLFDVRVGSFHSDPPTSALTSYYHSKGVANTMGLRDPELDKLIEDSDKSLDQKARYAMYDKIQRIILDKLYTIPTLEFRSFFFVQPWLNNNGPTMGAQSYVPQWDNVWIDTDKAPQRTLQ